MAGVNRVFLIGHVGRDAEVRYTQAGQAVASFSIATSESFSDKRTGEKRETVEWHNISAWGRLAEICGQYVRKGRQLFVEGKLQTRDWVDQQGVKHYKTEVVARTIQLLGRREDGGQSQSEYGAGGPSRDRTAYYNPPAPGDQAYEEYDLGDLGPPLDMDDSPLSPGD